MAERNGYADGEPCWVDVLTPDLDAGKRFYQAMFGWQYEDTGPGSGNYTMCLIDGKPVAGITPPAPGGEAGPPTWTVYLASSDVATTAAGIDEGGGKIVMGPLEVPGSGHMLVATDPTGALFGVWQGTGHLGSAYTGDTGTLAWSEVTTRDGAAADAFYRGLFGYDQEEVGGGME
jgi:predicted enzyme related to lactoylglutathione lyase